MRAAVALALVLAGVAPAWSQTTREGGWQPRTTAELVLLDKIRAQPSSVTVRVGQSVNVGTLTIAVRGCAARPADQPHDSAAFLHITDTRSGSTGFEGWILANTPAVSQFEDPIYDLRLIACR